jgi:hypothetical protein
VGRSKDKVGRSVRIRWGGGTKKQAMGWGRRRTETGAVSSEGRLAIHIFASQDRWRGCSEINNLNNTTALHKYLIIRDDREE